MTIEINTDIKINATPENVWTVFTDFENYPNWNPFIKSVIGDVEVGNVITVRIEPPESKGMTFKPKVLTYETNKELSWIGHLLIPGIFDGHHKFELHDNEDGTTTFRQSEKFNGIIVSFFKKELNIRTKNGFTQMNLKLKELAEKQQD